MHQTPLNVRADLDAGAVHLRVDREIYPLPAIYGASYVFIDRCFVFLAEEGEGRVLVTLQARDPNPAEEALRALVGEFSNELLSNAWRHQITAENRQLIESVTTLALGGAMGPPTLDDLASFDFTADGFEDPLGIAQSWEEKHGRKNKAQEAGAGDEEGER